MTRYDASNRREKRSYDGSPIPEGMAAAPVWLTRDFVKEADYIREECLTTWTFAGIRFLIGYVPVEPEMLEFYKKDCYKQINEYLKYKKQGRCILKYKDDGTPVYCPKGRKCSDCIHRGEYERDTAGVRELSLDELLEEPSCEDSYFDEYKDEEVLLAELIEHLAEIDDRYPAIIRMLKDRIPKKDICKSIQVGKSQGYKLIVDCKADAANYFGVMYR